MAVNFATGIVTLAGIIRRKLSFVIKILFYAVFNCFLSLSSSFTFDTFGLALRKNIRPVVFSWRSFVFADCWLSQPGNLVKWPLKRLRVKSCYRRWLCRSSLVRFSSQSVCMFVRSTNDPKVFKLCIRNDLGISNPIQFYLWHNASKNRYINTKYILEVIWFGGWKVKGHG